MTSAPLPVLTVTLNPALDLRQEVPEPRLHALNRARRVSWEPSGKGINVARALHEQGVPVAAVAPLGGLFGEVIGRALGDLGLRLCVRPIAGDTRLNVKVVDEDGRATEFNAPGPALSPADLDALWELLRAEVRPGSLVALCGSLPPGVPAGLYGEWTGALQALGARVAVDASGEALRLGLDAGPFLIKPNREEAEGLLGRSIPDTAAALRAAQELRDLGARNVALSLGEEGAVFLGEQAVLAQPPRVAVRSTVGCGDALLAGLLAGVWRGQSWSAAARHASAYAAARAGSDGPDFADPAAVRRLSPEVQVVALPGREEPR